jgi:hypothetical protein
LKSPIKPAFSVVIAGASSVVICKFYECEHSFPKEWHNFFFKCVLISNLPM